MGFKLTDKITWDSGSNVIIGPGVTENGILAYNGTKTVEVGTTTPDLVLRSSAGGTPIWGTGFALTTGSVTSDHIANGAILAEDIAAGTITATQIAAGTITATQIAAGTITATQIADDTITADQIDAGTITATQIAAGTITATQIDAGTITAGQIAAGTITATQIADNTITAGQIAAGTITATQIDAGTITATQIADDTITATQIANQKEVSFSTDSAIPTVYTTTNAEDAFVNISAAGTYVITVTTTASGIDTTDSNNRKGYGASTKFVVLSDGTTLPSSDSGMNEVEGGESDWGINGTFVDDGGTHKFFVAATGDADHDVNWKLNISWQYRA